MGWRDLCVLVYFWQFTSDWVSKDDWSNGSFQVLLLFQVPVCRRSWLFCDEEQCDPAVPGTHHYCATGTWVLQRAHGTRTCKNECSTDKISNLIGEELNVSVQVMKRPNCNAAKPLHPKCISCSEIEWFNETVSGIKKKKKKRFLPPECLCCEPSRVCKNKVLPATNCWCCVIAFILNANHSTIVTFSVQPSCVLCLRLAP